MHIRALERRKMRSRLVIYLANFFFTLHYAAILYVNSSYLSAFFSVWEVSLIFSTGAAASILLFLSAPNLLRIFGNKNLLSLLVVLEALAVGSLAFPIPPWSIALFSVIITALPLMIYYCLDLFLEKASVEKHTGEIRGINLTVVNLAIICAPLLVAVFARGGDFKTLYAVSALLIIPLVALASISLRKFADIRERKTIYGLPFRLWWSDSNIRKVTVARFILEVFYIVMVVFSPIYLNQYLGFSWQEIGIMFTIMLLPFILFELPAGELADHWCGEKEIMTVGFFLMGGALLVMPFIGKEFLFWSAVLFISRVGASLVEITTESYFFKQVDEKDHGVISIFRVGRPAAVIFGTLFAALIIASFSYSALFMLLALLVLSGMKESAQIVDTR